MFQGQWLAGFLVLTCVWSACGRKEKVVYKEIEYKADFTEPYEDNTDLPDYRLLLRTILPRSDKYDMQELFTGDRIAETYRFRIVEQEYRKPEAGEAKVFVQIGQPRAFVRGFGNARTSEAEALEAYLVAENTDPLDAMYAPVKEAPPQAFHARGYIVSNDPVKIGNSSYTRTDFTFSLENSRDQHVTSYYRMLDPNTILILRVQWSLADPEKWWPEASRALMDLFHSISIEKK